MLKKDWLKILIALILLLNGVIISCSAKEGQLFLSSYKKQTVFSMWHYSGGYWGGNIKNKLYDRDFLSSGGFDPNELADGAEWVAEIEIPVPEEISKYLDAENFSDNIIIDISTYKSPCLNSAPALEDLMYRSEETEKRIEYKFKDMLYTYEYIEESNIILLKFAPRLIMYKYSEFSTLGAPNFIPEVDNSYGYNLASMFKITNGPSLGGARIYWTVKSSA